MYSTSDTEQLKADLKSMIVEECDTDCEADEISDDIRLIGEGLELDSLDALQIALAVKDRYGVRIEGGPQSRRAMASVAALAAFIQNPPAEAAKAAHEAGMNGAADTGDVSQNTGSVGSRA